MRATPTITLLTCVCVGAAVALGACAPSSTPRPDATPPVTALLDEALAAMTDPAAFTAQVVAMEEIVAQCMHEQGWQYLPNPASYSTGSSEDDQTGGLSPEEYAATYGFGIAEMPETAYTTLSASDDPNAAYLETLSPTEAELWHEDYFGPPPDGGDGEIDWSKQGCFGKARLDIGESAAWDLSSDPRFKDVLDAANDIPAAARASQTAAAATAAWSSCMAASGHPGVIDPTTLVDDFYEDYATLVGDGSSPPSAGAIAGFTKKEIAAATASLACEAEAGYDAAIDAATLELETAFVAQHGSALEAYVEAVRTIVAEAGFTTSPTDPPRTAG